MKRALLLVGFLAVASFAGAQTKINLQTQVKGTLPTANGGLGTSLGAIDTLPLVTASGTFTFESVPDCADTGGNHLNYSTSTHTFSCGTTSSGGGAGLSDSIDQYGAACDGVTDDSAAFTSAATAHPLGIVVDKPGCLIGTNTTISVPVTFIGGSIDIATGVSVTFNGGVGARESAHIFNPTGTGKVVIGPGTPKVYAEWWGAVGDGSTDDSTAIQAAITSLYGAGSTGANDGHGGVQLLARVYAVSTGLTITHGGVGLVGINEGWNGSTNAPFQSALTTTSASLTLLTVSGASAAWSTDNRLKNFSVTRSVQPTGTATGISLTYLYRTVVDHVWSVNSIRGFYVANFGSGGSGIIEHCNTGLSSVSGAGTYYGFYVDETGSNTTPSLKMNYNTSGKGTGTPTTIYGFYATGPNIEDIHNRNYETAAIAFGVYLNSTGSSGYSNSDNLFMDNIHDGCLTSCYYITGMSSSGRSSVLITGGRISTNGTSPGADIESSNGVMLGHVAIASVTNSTTMVKISGGSGNGVIGNTFDDYGSSATYLLLNSTSNNVVANNRLHGNSGTVAASFTSATYNVFTGNTVGGTFTTGLSLDATSTSNAAYPNIYNGTITTPVSNSGGSTNITEVQPQITWPSSGNLLLSAGGTATPTGLAEVDGDCVVGASGAWTAGSCTGAGGGITQVTGPSSTVTGAVTFTGGGVSQSSGTFTFSGGVNYQVPLLSGLTWVNQGTATAVQAGGANTPILIHIPDNSSLNWRGLFATQPATPYSFVVELRPLLFYKNSQDVGVYFYDGTKLMGFEILSQGTGAFASMRVEKITNVNTDGSTAKAGPTFMPVVPLWIKLSNDGTTLTLYYSLDETSPSNWVSFYSESVGTYITPTKIGVGGLSVTSNASYYVENNILNWYTTSP